MDLAAVPLAAASLATVLLVPLTVPDYAHMLTSQQAERQGWEYYIQEPKKARIPPKTYADNYTYVPGKLRICHTK